MVYKKVHWKFLTNWQKVHSTHYCHAKILTLAAKVKLELPRETC